MNADLESQLDDPIELQLAEARLQLEKDRLRWRAVREFYRPILNALGRLGLEPRLTSTSIDLLFTGDAAKLAAVVRILRANGFVIESDRPKPGDTTWNSFFRHPTCPLRFWLNFSSSVCQRVKVGTRMVEQDIYETRCDSGDIAASVEIVTPELAPVEPRPLIEEIPF